MKKNKKELGKKRPRRRPTVHIRGKTYGEGDFYESFGVTYVILKIHVAEGTFLVRNAPGEVLKFSVWVEDQKASSRTTVQAAAHLKEREVTHRTVVFLLN